jgi:hypothetical protein
MNGKLAKEIKYDLDNTQLYNNDDLNKSITVKVDRSIIEKRDEITDELIEIGLNDLISMAVDNLKDVSKYIKKVNFKKSNKKSFMAKLYGIPLDVDLNPATQLYTSLRFVPAYHSILKNTLNRVDKIEEEYELMIKTGNFDGVNVFNKTTLLANLEGLKQIKLSLIKLEDGYRLLASNPTISRFLHYWSEYKNNGYRFPKVCMVNDEAFKFVDYYEELKVDGVNIFDKYNELVRYANKIKHKNGKGSLFNINTSFEAYTIYQAKKNNLIDRMIECINNLEAKLLAQKNNKYVTNVDQINSQLTSIGLIRNEFLKLKDRVNLLSPTDEEIDRKFNR